MNALEAAGVAYRIGQADLVNEVSLDVASRELVAVVGPNGAGKSTLLRLFAGELTPTSGHVTILGDPVAGLSLGELARRRSFLGQHAISDVPFTVREVVAMGRHPHRGNVENSAADDDRAVRGALEQMDLTHLADRVLASLSGGEEQRVHLARILAQQTPVTLLDEPTTALDVAHREMVSRTLRSLATAGAAVVSVLHDLNLAAMFADRVLLIDEGRTVACGAPFDVLRSDTLSDVYGHPITVIDHPYRAGPLVLPLDG